MIARKSYKYYAIRIANVVIFRRTSARLQKVRSLLYKPRTEFRLEQVTYRGGKMVGCMPYSDWCYRGNPHLTYGRATLITREQFRALDPYIYKEHLSKTRKVN